MRKMCVCTTEGLDLIYLNLGDNDAVGNERCLDGFSYLST